MVLPRRRRRRRLLFLSSFFYVADILSIFFTPSSALLLLRLFCNEQTMPPLMTSFFSLRSLLSSIEQKSFPIVLPIRRNFLTGDFPASTIRRESSVEKMKDKPMHRRSSEAVNFHPLASDMKI